MVIFLNSQKGLHSGGDILKLSKGASIAVVDGGDILKLSERASIVLVIFLNCQKLPP